MLNEIDFTWFDVVFYLLLLSCIIVIIIKAIEIIICAIKDVVKSRKQEAEEQVSRRKSKLKYIEELDSELKDANNLDEMWQRFYEQEQLHDLVLLLLFQRYIKEQKGDNNDSKQDSL